MFPWRQSQSMNQLLRLPRTDIFHCLVFCRWRKNHSGQTKTVPTKDTGTSSMSVQYLLVQQASARVCMSSDKSRSMSPHELMGSCRLLPDDSADPTWHCLISSLSLSAQVQWTGMKHEYSVYKCRKSTVLKPKQHLIYNSWCSHH